MHKAQCSSPHQLQRMAMRLQVGGLVVAHNLCLTVQLMLQRAFANVNVSVQLNTGHHVTLNSSHVFSFIPLFIITKH